MQPSTWTTVAKGAEIVCVDNSFVDTVVQATTVADQLKSFLPVANELTGLVSFVLEHVRVADQVGEIELAAATDALRHRSLAKDERSQVWSAITHLESAFRATLKAADDTATNHLRRVMLGESYEAYVLAILSRVRYIVCLMIVSYWILDEADLCKKRPAEN
jgi:hypothetical protein